MKKLLVLILLPFSVVAGVAERTVTYTEPTVNEDVTPVTDLAYTSIYYDINGDGNPPALYVNIPASAPTGGGAVSQILSLNLQQTESVQVWATSTDTSGNESTPTPVITVNFIPLDVLAPEPPQGFQVF